MSAATYLHIRSGDDSPERVLPLQGTRVRIGRGAQCEIQIDDPSLDEVALVLRRRGSAWHAHAAEPGGLLTIDDAEALGQRRIAQGSTLTIGDYRLTLRYVQTDEPAEPEVAESPISGESDEAGTSLDRRTERLEQWQASLERRERWLLARKERLKWEKRWRDAGERHRNRSVPAAPVAAPTPVSKTRMPQAPIDREKPAPFPPIRTVEAREAAPASRVREVPNPPVVEVKVEAPEPVRREVIPKLGSVTRVEPIQTEPVTPAEETAPAIGQPTEPTPVVSELLDPEALAARWAWETSGSAPSIKIAFAESRIHSPRPPRPAPPTREGPGPSDREPPRSWPLALPGRTDPTNVPELPTESLTPGLEPEGESRANVEIVWPSVAEIMQAYQASEEVASRPRFGNPKDQRLTEEREPAAWSVPALWVVPPALTMALMVLFGGVALSWTWSQDDRAAGQAANRLLSGAAVPSSGVGLEPLPRETWWSSTADHLYWHSVAQGRIEDDPGRAENAQFTLNLANRASPLHPGALDAQRRVSRTNGSETNTTLVSRDVVTLAREAGDRLKAGDREGGLALARQALEMAARSDPAQSQPAQKDSEGQSRRHLLPNEDLYLTVLHDLATEGGEQFADWSSAVPDYAPVLVSAYRSAQRLGRTDAEQALERAIALQMPPPGCSEAEQYAGQAEALAILGRWDESAEHYLKAIEKSRLRDHRRNYWLNLAEIHGRQGDLRKKRAALEQAWGAEPMEPEQADDVEAVKNMNE